MYFGLSFQQWDLKDKKSLLNIFQRKFELPIVGFKDESINTFSIVLDDSLSFQQWDLKIDVKDEFERNIISLSFQQWDLKIIIKIGGVEAVTEFELPIVGFKVKKLSSLICFKHV